MSSSSPLCMMWFRKVSIVSRKVQSSNSVPASLLNLNDFFGALLNGAYETLTVIQVKKPVQLWDSICKAKRLFKISYRARRFGIVP
ncbi:hypothetical protein MPL3365_130546 [Mesorhizobium plurifarium]|uniref:Uncharacterized protein n=1 Tax=Mesorhizobium plurifarium TaxID=69974 RepID=A0A090G3S4_MESPL|nr:hypothetical protein MPL3365_130546 [Mesorhizobium plurifarium]